MISNWRICREEHGVLVDYWNNQSRESSALCSSFLRIVEFISISIIFTEVDNNVLWLEKVESTGEEDEKRSIGAGDQVAAEVVEGECDVFSGRWVNDELNLPLYQEEECPYIQPQLTCQAHGRPEKAYQFRRWQPHGCSLPRFGLASLIFILLYDHFIFYLLQNIDEK